MIWVSLWFHLFIILLPWRLPGNQETCNKFFFLKRSWFGSHVPNCILPPALGFQDATLANAPSPELHAAWCKKCKQLDVLGMEIYGWSPCWPPKLCEFPGADTDIWCLGRSLRTGQVGTVGRVWIWEAQEPEVCQHGTRFIIDNLSDM